MTVPAGEPPSLRQRLQEVYRRLRLLTRATSASAALRQLCETLDQVEDEFSGIVKKRRLPPRPSLTGCSRQLVVIVFGPTGHAFTQPGPTALEQKSRSSVRPNGPTAHLRCTGVFRLPGSSQCCRQIKELTARWASFSRDSNEPGPMALAG